MRQSARIPGAPQARTCATLSRFPSGSVSTDWRPEAPTASIDPASVKLMGHPQILRGHVGSIARGINVANAQPNQQGLATVNPIFTWVRLAQRVPVRIEIDDVPTGVVLVAGMTATVQIDPRAPSAAK